MRALQFAITATIQSMFAQKSKWTGHQYGASSHTRGKGLAQLGDFSPSCCFSPNLQNSGSTSPWPQVMICHITWHSRTFSGRQQGVALGTFNMQIIYSFLGLTPKVCLFSTQRREYSGTFQSHVCAHACASWFACACECMQHAVDQWERCKTDAHRYKCLCLSLPTHGPEWGLLPRTACILRNLNKAKQAPMGLVTDDRHLGTVPGTQG